MQPRPIRLAWCALLAACTASSSTLAAPAALPPKCQALIEASIPGWRPSRPPPDAAAWARSQRVNPVVVSGDFDSDGTKDWGAIGTSPAGQHIVMCLGKGPRQSLRVLNHESCGDLIVLHAKGSTVHDYDAGRDVRLRQDSIGALCFEKAGQMISLEHGEFRVFTHSD
jgi:hypothetical protein